MSSWRVSAPRSAASSFRKFRSSRPFSSEGLLVEYHMEVPPAYSSMILFRRKRNIFGLMYLGVISLVTVYFLPSSKVTVGLMISALIASNLEASRVTSPGFSTRKRQAALAAMRPSAWEPEENLWAEQPTPSPAVNRPFTVVMRL